MRGGLRASCPVCLIEGRPRPATATKIATKSPRFGFTVTKKLGNAVARNRIRRRLKAAIGAVAPTRAEPSYDYVIIARAAALDRPFATLVADLDSALAALHRRRQNIDPAAPSGGRRPSGKKATP